MAYGELAVCVLGIYACFLTWQVTQERVSTTPYDGHKFRHFIFLNTVQAATASVVAFLYLRLRGRTLSNLSAPLLRSYFQCAVCSTLASPFSYASLKHIDYPTMILGKSCKLVPVLLMNFLIYRRTFPVQKYVVVALVTVGVSAFMLLHKQEGHKGEPRANSFWGLGLLTVGLLIDGATNSTQDQIFRRFRTSGSEMMVFMNLFSCALMTGYLIAFPGSTELADALAFCSAHPKVVGDILLFGLCGAVGQCFIFHTLERFGSVGLVTVTVTRKMFSILLSIFWFDHQLSWGQWVAVAVVFLGIGGEALAKGGGGKEKEKEKVDAAVEVELEEKGKGRSKAGGKRSKRVD
ncbi:UAA transporter [Blyttiomyces helicus]|uniref:UDP-galactose transporter homolog 1 n=1 Tax=Blyttiomyces helicus TaxID=388810 RepID=A0A4P9W4K9_9FUNG|nr:UAA transporter [Blyttiomyces helicus]|eukprot:RKO87291.1 UAA transporter [Blyttiomyces helicus]